MLWRDNREEDWSRLWKTSAGASGGDGHNKWFGKMRATIVVIVERKLQRTLEC